MKKGIVITLIILSVLLGVGGYFGKMYYDRINANNIADKLSSENNIEFYIHTGDTYDDVKKRLSEAGILKDVKSFDWVAEQMNLAGNIYAGKYTLSYPMSNRQLILKLRTGDRTPVWIQLHRARTVEQFAKQIAGKLEANTDELLSLLKSEQFLREHKVKEETLLAHIIPMKYQFEWNTSAEQFMERMFTEYEKFWTAERKNKAAQRGLTPVEVSIVASIVEQESQAKPERPDIAGVYLNRLKKNWKLQADPTVIYAIGDFTINRVLYEHLEYESPYNTYLNIGLPPGPICIPSESSILAVLNAPDHDYMYFCANPDFSGTHVFAKTLSQHNRNAKAFQAELNRRGI